MVALSTLVIFALPGAPRLPVCSSAPISDYVQYWSAARLILDGGNPHDWDELLEMQRQVEPRLATPVMLWNPPWTLSLVALPGLLPYSASRIL